MRSSLGHRLLQHAVRGLEPGHRRVALLGAAEDGHVHACLAQVGAGVHRGNGHKSYAWVAEPFGDPG